MSHLAASSTGLNKIIDLFLFSKEKEKEKEKKKKVVVIGYGWAGKSFCDYIDKKNMI